MFKFSETLIYNTYWILFIPWGTFLHIVKHYSTVCIEYCFFHREHVYILWNNVLQNVLNIVYSKGDIFTYGETKRYNTYWILFIPQVMKQYSLLYSTYWTLFIPYGTYWHIMKPYSTLLDIVFSMGDMSPHSETLLYSAYWILFIPWGHFSI